MSVNENPSDKYEDLINEFVEQRNAIKLMIEDLEKFQQKVEILFPDSVDKRYKFFFEEKVKTITELFRVILDMRREIIKTTKDEIELRKKFLGGEDDDIDIEGIFNIKKIAEKVEKLRKESIAIEQKTKITLTEGSIKDVVKVPENDDVPLIPPPAPIATKEQTKELEELLQS